MANVIIIHHGAKSGTAESHESPNVICVGEEAITLGGNGGYHVILDVPHRNRRRTIKSEAQFA